MAESFRTGAVCEICNGVGRKATEHRARHHILAAQDAFGAPPPPAPARGGHSENPSDLQANSATEAKGSWKSEQPCNLFRQGDCKYGDRCKFVHDDGQELVQDFYDRSDDEDIYACTVPCPGPGADSSPPQRESVQAPSGLNSVPVELIRQIPAAPKQASTIRPACMWAVRPT